LPRRSSRELQSRADHGGAVSPASGLAPKRVCKRSR
jgi:hypothetical protein